MDNILREDQTMPNAVIYYFSATGNSLWIARAMADKLGGVDLIPMTRSDAHEPPPDTSVVGLIFPVYVFGLPLIVTRFIRKLNLPKNAYLFAVAVNGGMLCSTLIQASRLCSDRGMELAAGFSVRMVDNYTPIAGAISAEKQKIRFDEAGLKINGFCAAIRNRQRTLNPGWPLINWFFSGMYRRWVKNASEIDKPFMAESDCIGCGVCENVCPVENIKMNSRKPAWQHHCEGCFGCLHWCPHQAIQYGRKTKGRTRYHHPEVTLNDIMIR
jgi:Pyruvate/2-oxoacid:ferredoxin oxidoreductase delta subunit